MPHGGAAKVRPHCKSRKTLPADDPRPRGRLLFHCFQERVIKILLRGHPSAFEGGLLSHAEANYSGCCAAFGPGGSLKGSRPFLANSRNKYFGIIARDSVSGPFDLTSLLRSLHRRIRRLCSMIASRRPLRCGKQNACDSAGYGYSVQQYSDGNALSHVSEDGQLHRKALRLIKMAFFK